ncbi:hypothetical protein LMTR13_24800 [Bradyrhizobium icense]|uniref:Uncharacterized protein n=1 Tax=Bradyrhizobium icense TaxID=1274631 RepID=A0A1B1UJC7_9BRAD|nr:hypothetical protein LMTR13_24800 [Bradyrhizobium icense]
MSFFVKGRNCDKERRRTIAVEQPIPVLVGHGGVPYRTIDRQFDNSTKQKIVVELLDQLPLRSHRVERVQQQSPQRAARAGSTNGFQGVKPPKSRDRSFQRCLKQFADRPQGERAAPNRS